MDSIKKTLHALISGRQGGEEGRNVSAITRIRLPSIDPWEKLESGAGAETGGKSKKKGGREWEANAVDKP